MQQVRNVTGTAFVVAEFRAEENFATRPLYTDSVVHLFLSEETRHAAARVATGFPLMKEMMKIRSGLSGDLGLALVDNFTTGELHRAYRRDANASKPAFGPFYSVCTLASL